MGYNDIACRCLPIPSPPSKAVNLCSFSGFDGAVSPQMDASYITRLRYREKRKLNLNLLSLNNINLLSSQTDSKPVCCLCCFLLLSGFIVFPGITE